MAHIPMEKICLCLIHGKLHIKLPWIGTTTFYARQCNDVDAHIDRLYNLQSTSLDVNMPHSKYVRFDESRNSFGMVTPYSEIYGLHPSRFVFDAHGKFIMLSKLGMDDPFTGISIVELMGRKDKLVYDSDARARILRRTLLDGPNWEEDTAEIIANLIAKINPKKFKQKRIGVKAAKKAEFESKGEVLNEAEATQFRALAARANYLAADRPDIQYAVKEVPQNGQTSQRRLAEDGPTGKVPKGCPQMRTGIRLAGYRCFPYGFQR